VPQLSAELATATTISGTTSIQNDVRMVIWDLDETFWKGTLAESDIEFVPSNAAIVCTLAARGIISSIASKNNHDAARRILEREGIWEYFVFPSISFEPKGQRVAKIIGNAGLRAQNVLFVDDNVMNLEEARHFNKGIMVAHPAELIPIMLDHPCLAGKADPKLKRLKQYQLLQRKIIDQQSTDLSNEEFLRSSGISISFDFDIEANFERIVDLINRANQLNYTKKRLKTSEELEAFRSSFNNYGVSAACISCQDKYGDYGVIGFFMLKRNRKQFELIHFVFSCRTMNMGIEQFVYERLGRPDITIVPEVAYPLNSHQTVDWITLAQEADKPTALLHNEKKLLLVGGCELLQLSSFCSPNRTEFVNRTEVRNGDEYVVRYDDPSFFLADRDILRRSGHIKELSAWTYEDAINLDHHLQDASIIILSMREGLNHNYVRTKDGVSVRIPARNMHIYRTKRFDWFRTNFTILNLNMKERLELIEKSFELTRQKSSPHAAMFILGANTRNEVSQEQIASSLYNEFCRRFCQRTADRFYFIDVDQVVPAKSLLGSRHFTRDGYYALSMHIMDRLSARSENGRVPANDLR
jgi:FkbH-like protein